jgi:GDSL-like Lipase/Acylhydrolase family
MRRERNHWLSARDTGATVIHSLGIQTAYLSQSGDQTGAKTIPDATTVTERYFFTRIEVSSNNAGTIVALGDPITDGRGSTGDLKRLIVRAHARHLKIFGATYLPGEGDLLYSEEAETKRKAVNEWIRTSNAFDAVIDFEAVVRDPSHPTRLRPEYDSGDHGHLNDAGYRALADSIDLKLFTNP